MMCVLFSLLSLSSYIFCVSLAVFMFLRILLKINSTTLVKLQQDDYA